MADHVLRNNALEQLKERLGRLWTIRSQRESQFGEVINTIQLLLLDQDVEKLTDSKLSVLHSILEQLREKPDWDDELVKDVIIELLRNDIDVFRGIE